MTTQGRDRLRDAKVMVVGCGALGNEVLKNLVLCGVGHLVCVDFDRVETGNLTRSVLFRQADADTGRLKVDVVKERLLEINPDVDICALDADIVHDVGLGIIRKMDVVVSCVDSRWARFVINRHCIRMNRPWVDGGIALAEGTVKVFVPGRNCYACSLSSEEIGVMKRRLSCANAVSAAAGSAVAPTSSITASVIGAVQVREAVRIICGDTSNCGKMFYYDGDVPTAGVAQFDAYDEDCPEHETWGPVEPSRFTVDTAVSDFLSSFPDDVPDVSIQLREDKFVDWLEDRRTGERHKVMLPGRFVAGALPRGASPEDFYQNEYRTVDAAFPYGDLTLGALGIPRGDVLHVCCAGKDRFLELGWE